MEKSRIDSVTLLAAIIACSVGLLALPGDFGYLIGVAGLVLLLILFAHDQEGYRSGLQSLAFAGVGGFCLVLVSSAPFHYYLGQARDITSDVDRHAFLEKWSLGVWVVGTLLAFAIDRVRMSSREAVSLRLTGAVPAVPLAAQYAPPSATGPIVVRGRAPNSVASAPIPGYPVSAMTAPPIPFSAPPPPPQPVSSATSMFETPTPGFEAQTPVPAAGPPASSFAPTPQSPWGSVPPPPAPAPQAALKLAPPGKETTIYVNLVGEGLNVLRSVRAEHMGRDFYRIVEEMPAGESWEYQPGQVVRCKKKSLSTGKHLVAMEEAPRAT
jgi:hypothetical protein